MADTITFSEFPVGTWYPVYTFADNVVSCLGYINTDSAAPGSPVMESDPNSHAGPVYAQFENPVQTVAFDAGYFDNLNSTEVIFLGTDGSILHQEITQSTGYPCTFPTPRPATCSSRRSP